MKIRAFLDDLSPAAREKYAPELDYILRTPNSATNPAIYYRAWRDHNMGKARLCATVAGRRTWFDLARNARREMVAVLRARQLRERNEAMRFGNYRQREAGPGVYQLVPEERVS